MTCEHKNTQIWEPHLAGTRKCKDCGMIKHQNNAYIGLPVWEKEKIKIAFESEIKINGDMAYVSFPTKFESDNYNIIGKRFRVVLEEL